MKNLMEDYNVYMDVGYEFKHTNQWSKAIE